VSNLLLHAGVSLLSLLFVQRLARRGPGTAAAFSSGPAVPAFFALVLFAVFPRRVETVAWISCRPDLLAALFAITAALLYVKALADESHWLAVPAGLLWFASLLSKESAILMPLALWPVAPKVGKARWPTFNDRLLYLPGIGMACLLAAAFATIPARWLAVAGTTAAIVCGVWTAAFAHRWHVAGALSQDLIRQLAVQLSAEQRRNVGVHLAAVPDSYGGAYMLRTAIPHALYVAGVRDVPRVVVLTRYLLVDLDAAPVEALQTETEHLRLNGCRGRPELLVETEPSLPILQRSPEVSADRYGRYAAVEFAPPRGTVPLMATHGNGSTCCRRA
jgi:hypothetical protein